MRREETAIAMYYRVAETLKRRIASAGYRPGAILPSESELAREFGVSNITIRKAMALLTEQGLVHRRRGIGTQAAASGPDRIPLKITGNFRDWVDSAVNRRLQLEVTVQGMEIIPCPSGIGKQLNLPEGSPVWEIKRLRKRKGETVSSYINYVSTALLKDLPKNALLKDSFLEVFHAQTGLDITALSQQVETAVADLDTGAALGVGFGSPLFFVTHIYWSAEKNPLFLTRMFFRGDRYVYRGYTVLNLPMEKTA